MADMNVTVENYSLMSTILIDKLGSVRFQQYRRPTVRNGNQRMHDNISFRVCEREDKNSVKFVMRSTEAKINDIFLHIFVQLRNRLTDVIRQYQTTDK